ncbi:MAG: DEAD/DEAH box helicase, partial [bacterium]|nr:DEAD/DEAH box helicase [bacterium]
GVLADDMGLGKTVQFLAHAAIERAAGRLDAPILIVAPTSVAPNWRAEIARFVPSLRVLSLTGADRATRFSSVGDADVVLTTYALLPRDAEFYLTQRWSLAVLDEAQAIKNPRVKAAAVARRLRARQRIAMTGTPIENHLDELWSILAFAQADVLGDRASFRRGFRTPIEKRGDSLRQSALAARLRPFLLRRTKERVAQELPEKTEIVQRVELTGEQRDLYETIRLAMHERVRAEVERRGLARSRIVVLDALLKLRQVCCDPRLLHVPAAAGVTESHKLEALLEMLESLIADGRRILLFSQFTSMLDLIKPELGKRAIPFVELRGETRDRETPVARFQNREVPLFLISLKAGGTGLNLTAADTVIHYDPWWNPAVERQATDRAHRIGQEQHVFVYKLIAEGTVEERILDLQARKGALAQGLFDETSNAPLRLDLHDLERLFA